MTILRSHKEEIVGKAIGIWPAGLTSMLKANDYYMSNSYCFCRSLLVFSTDMYEDCHLGLCKVGYFVSLRCFQVNANVISIQ